ncbi:ATP-binding protein [Acanthopleuribacter pedis]|uniref:Biotin/lipoyl-binding protein n=1 Tax=Acanthopleuribacter pedis TaxID=442870 RepID=A0A8J7QNJ9_9BACT|nr:biotin/lipoyl-binding protein [Acanthopleuribacter pedis]
MSIPVLQPGDRIAIVNRGESANRFLNALDDFNRERGTELRSIALYTRPDQHARFVQRADYSFCLGDALEPDLAASAGEGGPVLKSPYLQYERLREALVETKAKAVWVGWGFVAEHAEFSDLCRDMGICFIGPTGDAMRKLGDKIGSKHLAESAGVPVSPWSKGPVPDVKAAKAHGKKIGYPLVIKATAGGGGRGIRKVMSESEIKDAFESATSEAAKAFGDGTVFMEKMIIGARHLEIQVLADTHENVWAVGVRDCSVQRRNQKVIEEGPAPILTPEQDGHLREAARGIARASGYHNAGTAEFLFEQESGEFYFMEMNTRLQVEHPVTELTTGFDMVKGQIHVAMGGELEGESPVTVGHAIEVRLNAEDPYNQFAPSPGHIELFNPPGGPGIRVDSGIETFSEIPSSFDSMVAKIMAYGRTREEALARLTRAVRDTTVVIQNGTTNKSFLLELLNNPVVKNNSYHTAWLDRQMEEGAFGHHQNRQSALIAAGIEMYSAMLHEQRKEFFQTVSRGRPQRLPIAGNAEVEMKLNGQSYKLGIRLIEPKYYQIHHEGRFFTVKMVADTPYKSRLYYDQVKYDCLITPKQDDYQVEINGLSYLVEKDSGGIVKSNSPALLLKLLVQEGQEIKEGEPLLSLEAMKMEMVMLSPQSGTVRQLFVKAGDQVAAGDPLVSIETDKESSAIESTAEAVTFAYDSQPEQERDQHDQVMRECRGFLKGFDIHGDSFDSLVSRLKETVDALAQTDAGKNTLIEFLEDLYQLYRDIEFLFQKEVSLSETDISSPEQNFFIYLALLRSGQEHPVEDFNDCLKLVYSHYGVSLETPIDELEEVIIRLFSSHHYHDRKIKLLRTLHDAFSGSRAFTENDLLKNLVDKQIQKSRLAFRSLHNLLVDFFYSVFENASFTSVSQLSPAKLHEVIDQILGMPQGSKRGDLTQQLIFSPHALVKLLISRFGSAEPGQQGAVLELLMRRMHLEVSLNELQIFEENDRVFVLCAYAMDRNRVVSVGYGDDYANLDAVLAHAGKTVKQQRDANEIEIDLYFHSAETLNDEAYQAQIKAALATFPKVSLLTKIRFMISDSLSIPRCFMFVHDQSGYRERRSYRGLTENMGQRFYIDRLQGFHTERLPTEEHIYLFHCKARENDEDQRLIAFTEIREQPPEPGQDFVYPALHREFLRVLRALRQKQNQFGPKSSGSFYWNQIIIYIRPLLNVSRESLLAYLRFIISGYEHVHLEKVRIYCLLSQPHGDVANLQIEVNFPADVGIEFRYSPPSTPAIKPLSSRDLRHALARRRGLNYPYEVLELLTNGYFYKGEFEEFDMERGENGAWQAVSVKGRPPGQNRIGIVFGIITNYTPGHQEGMRRVIVLNDGNFGLCALSEPECRSILAAIELADKEKLPVEWFAVSSGAKISMENGTENLDWTARVLREIIHFTQKGGEINIIVDGINVGAQSYWNAEATMMMHTAGCLIMTPRGTMVLTGKGALDYAGSVSAEDNIGIGGMQRIMGPNGQAQYPAKNLLEACQILFRYYSFTYCQPNEAYPRVHLVEDAKDRDVTQAAYAFDLTPDFKQIGDIFSDATNPGKKKPFDMRQVMRNVADHGCRPLERWPLMAESDTALIWEVTLGGYCATMIGIQSFPIKRRTEVPNDGPDTWSGGTLFPLSSKKLARGINASSGRRPVVILANLSGFDGSPESLRRLQLEYGAEIGRAVVNFKGMILFVVLSRYHGGAYVVFSNVLNPGLKAVALEGTYASVIGGAPAAAVVFPRVVRKRALADPRITSLQKQLEVVEPSRRDALRREYQETFDEVYRAKQTEMANEFEEVHTVERAKQVGSLDDIIKPEQLRPFLVQKLAEEYETRHFLKGQDMEG